jgi:hypothetical protein
MVALGAPHREDRRRGTTSPTVLDMDLRRIGVMNNVVGKKRDVVKRNGGLKKNDEGKMIEGLQIKSDFV